jgi:hypothetical protein
MTAMPLPEIFSLLTPLLWVAAMFLLLLAVRSVLQNRSPRKWRDRETIEWDEPRPNLIQRWRMWQMPAIAPKPAPSVPANAPADPLKNPTQPMPALFGSTVNGSTIDAPETKRKDVFAWEKTKGIE